MKQTVLAPTLIYMRVGSIQLSKSFPVHSGQIKIVKKWPKNNH